MDEDPAIQTYYKHCSTHRGNAGNLSPNTMKYAHSAVKAFLNYSGIQISNHAILDLVNYKRNHPLSDDIERCVQDFGAEQPIKAYAGRANCILGIFRANFARLNVTINNHFEPNEEDCSTETFLKVYEAMDEETRDLIQWGVYCREGLRLPSFFVIPHFHSGLTGIRTEGQNRWLTLIQNAKREESHA